MPDKEQKKIHVLLVDDHKYFRESLADFLNEAPGLEIIGKAKDGVEAEEMAHILNPHIILMDIKMPNKTGIEATRDIKAQKPDIKIILYSMHQREVFETKKLEAADRFIPKQALFDELERTIKEVWERK